MVRERGESETEHFYRQQESATSSSYASPAHRSHLQPQPRQLQQQPRENQLPRQPQPVQLPEYKVVNVKEPPKSYDSSFHCIHTSIEIVVVVSLVSLQWE